MVTISHAPGSSLLLLLNQPLSKGGVAKNQMTQFKIKEVEMKAFFATAFCTGNPKTKKQCSTVGSSSGKELCVGCQGFWTVLGPRDWGEEAPGLRVSLTS